MSRKLGSFDLRICKCGHLHFIDPELQDKALSENKNLMVICGNCGRAILIGADLMADEYEPDKMAYHMYTGEVSTSQVWDESLFTGTETKKAVSNIYYSKGIAVYMNTGYKATVFDGPRRCFNDMIYPDFYKIEGETDAAKIHAFIEQWQKDRVTVNMNMLLRMLTDEQARILRAFNLNGMDWSDTKYK